MHIILESVLLSGSWRESSAAYGKLSGPYTLHKQPNTKVTLKHPVLDYLYTLFRSPRLGRSDTAVVKNGHFFQSWNRGQYGVFVLMT